MQLSGNDVLNVTGSLPTAVTISTAVNCSLPLAKGIYALWSITLTTFIGVNIPTASALTTTTGIPIPAVSKAVLVNVPENGQIFGVSSTAATLLLQKVG